MIKKLVLLLLSLIMILAFCGCQLAEQGKGDPNTDAFCGILLTFGGMDSDGNNVANAITGNIPLYATAKPDENGNTDYVFVGVKGVRLFSMLLTNTGEAKFYKSCQDYMADTKTSYVASDTSTDISLEGTLYVYLCDNLRGRMGECAYYCNPVYQDPEGGVYVLPAECGFVITDGDIYEGQEQIDLPIGDLGAKTITKTSTVNINGSEQIWTMTVKITVMSINDIQKYVLKQMDTQDNVISALEITEGSIPKEIRLNDTAAYVMLEEHSIDPKGDTVIERSLVDLKLPCFYVRFPGENGFAQDYKITIK